MLTVTADDRDDPKTNNTKVFYMIKNITSSNGGAYDRLEENCNPLFSVKTINEATAEIFTNCHLKGYYGRWSIELYVGSLFSFNINIMLVMRPEEENTYNAGIYLRLKIEVRILDH